MFLRTRLNRNNGQIALCLLEQQLSEGWANLACWLALLSKEMFDSLKIVIYFVSMPIYLGTTIVCAPTRKKERKREGEQKRMRAES